MIYCKVREDYVEQKNCCVLCKDYEEKIDKCKYGEKKDA
jgi:hypothetical protein